MKYPTAVVENFFENPKEVIKYAKTLDYETPKPSEYWIGQRSHLLHVINPNLFKFIVEKVISVFYDGSKEDIRFDDAQVCFQKISKEDWDKNKISVHRDIGNSLSGVIYLSENENYDNGTRLMINDKKEHMRVASKFNSMICYEGNQLHGPIGSTDDDRLTIVFFIHNIIVEKSPYERLNSIKGF